MKSASAELWRGLVVVAVLVAVQLGASAFYWIPEARTATLLAPTGDVVGLVLIVVAWSFVPRSWSFVDRAIAVALPLFLLLVIAVALGQGLLKREFGQDLVLVVDVKYVSSLVKLLFDNEPLPRFLLWMLLVLAGLALAVVVTHHGLLRVRAHLAAAPSRSLALVAGTLVYFAVAAAFAGVRRPVALEAASQVGLALRWDESLQKTARRLDEEAAPQRTLALPRDGASEAVRPRHIYVFVVESYGATLFSGRPGAAADFAAFLAGQQQALARAGYQTRSTFVSSPVFGSGSWMPDATLLCGVRIDNQKRFAALFHSDVRCLPKFLKAGGYRTVLAAANTDGNEPRFARTYAFDASYFRHDFDYAGPRFGWSFMPDQFVIGFVHEREVVPHRRDPLFLEMVLTSSHVPWSVVPPMVGWAEMGDGRIFDEQQPQRFGNFLLSGGEYEAGYLASIEYSLAAVTGYLERLPADDSSLAIVLGDHQPRNPIADRFADPWWVPVHLLARDPRTVEAFASLGFVDGLVPVAPAKGAPGMERLMPALLRATGARAP
ncbi:MAG TPA: hypothetical protein VF334_07345 [Polyangia bacterium]